MPRPTSSRAARSLRAPCLALLAAALLPVAAARAQSVQIFDEAPSLDQLRSIMIPQSRGDAGRSIVLAPQARPAAAGAVQMAAAHVAPAPALPPLQPAAASAHAAEPASVVPAAGVVSTGVAGTGVASTGVVGLRINFALDSDVIPPGARPLIARIGEFLAQERSLKLRIEGHTDARGPDDYNLDLSRRRGLAVASQLVEQGIAPDRLVVVGVGKQAPLLDDPYDPRNRRVQFARID